MINSIHRQKGMSAVGWVGVFALIAIVTLLVLKLFPIYLDSFKVGSILETLKEERDTPGMTPGQVTQTIMKRVDINMVDGVTTEDVFVARAGKKMTIEIDYEVREKIMGNVDVVVHFQKSVEVPIN